MSSGPNAASTAEAVGLCCWLGSNTSRTAYAMLVPSPAAAISSQSASSSLDIRLYRAWLSTDAMPFSSSYKASIAALGLRLLLLCAVAETTMLPAAATKLNKSATACAAVIHGDAASCL